MAGYSGSVVHSADVHEKSITCTDQGSFLHVPTLHVPVTFNKHIKRANIFQISLFLRKNFPLYWFLLLGLVVASFCTFWHGLS